MFGTTCNQANGLTFGLGTGSGTQNCPPNDCVIWFISVGPDAGKFISGGGTLAFVSSAPVGGEIVPVDRLALLAPFIGLASLIVAAATITAVYVRRAKHREEKQ
jgi:hypothetical protein